MQSKLKEICQMGEYYLLYVEFPIETRSTINHEIIRGFLGLKIDQYEMIKTKLREGQEISPLDFERSDRVSWLMSGETYDSAVEGAKLYFEDYFVNNKINVEAFRSPGPNK